MLGDCVMMILYGHNNINNRHKETTYFRESSILCNNPLLQIKLTMTTSVEQGPVQKPPLLYETLKEVICNKGGSCVPHYETEGSIFARITDAIVAEKGAVSSVGVKEINETGLDEFHIGQAPATDELLSYAPTITKETTLLEIGCGIGGPSRHIANKYGCKVVGIDLTKEYVDTARAMSEKFPQVKEDLRKSGGSVNFHQVDATDTDACKKIFENEQFDMATLLHVGMNIADKYALARTVYASLKLGGIFLLYDQMSHLPKETWPFSKGQPSFVSTSNEISIDNVNDQLTYPLPWATVRENSHVAPVHEYEDALKSAGFVQEAIAVVTEKRDKTFYRDYRLDETKGIEESHLPGMGIHVLMHPALFKQKVGNMKRDWAEGKMGCVIMVWRKPSS